MNWYNKYMKKPEIIFIDLDDTALDAKENGNKAISDENAKVIKLLSQRIPVIVSTGRGDNENTRRMLKKIDLNTFIAWNGSKIVVNGELIKKSEIDRDVVQELFDQIVLEKAVIIFNSNFSHTSFVRNKLFQFLFRLTGRKIRVYKEFRNEFLAYKVLVWCPSKRKLQRLYKKWLVLFAGKLNVTLSGNKSNYIEITAANVSKGEAERYLCNLWNIDPLNAIHIGDSMNDASTKGVVGKVVAMQNSAETFKNIADEISPYPCKNAGLGKYLSQFLED